MTALNDFQQVGPADKADSERVAECPCCGSRSRDLWLHGYDRQHAMSRERFTFDRCRECGAYFQSYRPKAAVIGQYYPSDYVPHSAAKQARIASWRKSLLRLAGALGGATSAQRRVERVYRRISPGTVFLDFGCGSGKFLDRMQRRGARTIGMDISPRALDQVRAHHHEALEISEASWERVATGGVDFVRLNHVMEHLYDPNATLHKIWGALRTGGVLHIAVPNPAGVSAKIFGSYWYGLDCPRHIVLYPPATLVKLLEATGFRDVTVIAEPAVKDFARSVGYFLRALGLWRGTDIDSFVEKPSMCDTSADRQPFEQAGPIPYCRTQECLALTRVPRIEVQPLTPTPLQPITQASSDANRLIAWKLDRARPKVASVRYRCLLPMMGLKPLGWDSLILEDKDGIADFSKLAALVLVKTFSDHDVKLAQGAAAASVPVFLDICDNIFVDGYGGAQGDRARQNFMTLCTIASAVVTTGPAMASLLSGILPAGTRIVTIVDQAERPESTAQLLGSTDWMDDRLGIRTLTPEAAKLPRAITVKRVLRRIKRKLRRWTRATFQRLNKACYRLITAYHRLNGDWRLRARPAGKRVLWFGMHGAKHGRSGLQTLLDIAAPLQEAARRVPFELLIVSDNRKKFAAIARQLGVPAIYKPWDPIEIFDDIRGSNVILLPNSQDDFSVVKSANRAVLSLSLGTPAIATYVPALEPLRDCLLFDDWANSIVTYLTDGALRKRHLSSGNRIIEESFSPEVVAHAWHDLLERTLAGHSAR